MMIGCTRQVDMGNTSSTSTTTTYSGGGTSNPSKATYTPISPTGDTSNWHAQIDSNKYKLTLTPTFVTPCATSNIVVSYTVAGTNIPSNATYEWYFGDGTSQKTTTPTTSNTYKFSNPSYDVLVKIDTGINNTVIAQLTKTIKFPTIPIPTADFTLQQKDLGTKVVTFAFNAFTSKVSSGIIKNYHWTFGDGSASVDTADYYLTHTYTKNSTLQKDTVTLTVKSDLGCLGSKYNIIDIPN